MLNNIVIVHCHTKEQSNIICDNYIDAHNKHFPEDNYNRWYKSKTCYMIDIVNKTILELGGYDLYKRDKKEILEFVDFCKNNKIKKKEDKIKLKKCPFCDGNGELKIDTFMDGGYHYKAAYVYCTKCGAKTKQYILDGYYGFTYTEQDAIKLWNTRTGSEN